MKAPGVGAAVLVALVAAVPASAQPTYRYSDPLTLVGPGSAIGARVRDITADEATQAKLAEPIGVYIQEVDTGAPADRAGIKAGDIVVEFDGEHVRSVRAFQRLVAETPPGRTVTAVVVRDGARQTLEVTPLNSERLAMNRRFPLPRQPLPAPVPSQPRLGITLGPLDGQMADFFGVSAGVLVSAVDRDSPAARAGVKAGDVITAVNGHAVRQPGEVGQDVREATGPVELTIVRDKKEMKVRVTPEVGGATVRLPL